MIRKCKAPPIHHAHDGVSSRPVHLQLLSSFSAVFLADGGEVLWNLKK